MQFGKRIATLAATWLVFLMATAGVGLAADNWDLVGTWKISVTGARCANAQVVTIGTATPTKVLGTTNVGDSYGKIIGGSFDGVNANFKNVFIWDGKKHTESWAATLSRNGNTIKGSYKDVSGQSPTCKFSGRRQ